MSTGNGKRSGFDNPSLNTDNQKQLLLKRLLLRAEPETDRPREWEESIGQDFEREELDNLSQPDIRQLTDLVRELVSVHNLDMLVFYRNIANVLVGGNGWITLYIPIHQI